MDTKIKILLTTAIILATVVSSCHKRCIPKNYSLTGGVSIIFPEKDSIRVGDTLWFNSVIPINLKYSQRNISDSGSYDISGATNIVTDFQLTNPLGVNMQAGAMDSFSFLPGKGTLQINPLDPTASKTVSYVGETTSYFCSFGIIARKKGIYFFGIIDVYQGMKECDKFSVAISMSDANNHLYYLKNIYYGGAPISPLDSTHIYCFKVY